MVLIVQQHMNLLNKSQVFFIFLVLLKPMVLIWYFQKVVNYLKKIKLQQLSNTINTDFKLQFNKKVFLNSLKKFKFSYYVKTIFLNKNYKKKIWLEKFSYIKKKYTKPYSLLYKKKYLIKKIKKFNFKSYYKNFIIFANFSKKSKNNLINLINKSFFVQY